MRPLSLFLSLFLVLSVAAQPALPTDSLSVPDEPYVPTVKSFSAQTDSVSALINAQLGGFRIEGYRMSRPFRADRQSFDTLRRHVDVTVCEDLYSAPLTTERIAELYDRVRQALQTPAVTVANGEFDFSTLTPRLFGRTGLLETYVPNAFRSAADADRQWASGTIRQAEATAPWVKRLDWVATAPGGLAGRHFFVSISHGAYHNNSKDVWDWQRPRLFCTSEDLLTQSVVRPFLLPMLERSGAVVYTARERDAQTFCALVDNDAMASEGLPHGDGDFQLTGGTWQSAGEGSGYGHTGALLVSGDQPFRRGTSFTSSAADASARYVLQVPAAGDYAVYVSYRTLAASTSAAEYTVRHAGGRTRFAVNQQIGGSTWVYLGTFHFRRGQAEVSVRNAGVAGSILSTDAVRLGGGMGQTAYGTCGTSGLPRVLECAAVHGIFSGMPPALYASAGTGAKQRYNDDIRCRPLFANHLAAGSPFQPSTATASAAGETPKRVPFSYYIATHTDAGARPSRDIVGTLACVTTWNDNSSTRLPGGPSRTLSRDNAAVMMHHIQADLSRLTAGEWNQRQLWDRNYGETRLCELPAHIIEMFSHQNFGDLRYGLDPEFRFCLARAMYKGILEQTYAMEGQTGAFRVQPLAPQAFRAAIDRHATRPEARQLDESHALCVLSWQAVRDTLCAGAEAEGFILYIAQEDGGFDNGRALSLDAARETLVQIRRGRTYHFCVSATNAGGESAPSETLSVFAPLPEHNAEARGILVVNGFTRLSAPWILDDAERRGFDLDEDLGVERDLTTHLCGRQRCFTPSAYGGTGDGALGDSSGELEGRFFLGNTFDFPRLHAAAWVAATGGRCFVESASLLAFEQGGTGDGACDVVDFFTGRNRTMPHAWRQHPALGEAACRALDAALADGTALVLSGEFLASDNADATARRRTQTLFGFTGGRAAYPSLRFDSTLPPSDTTQVRLTVATNAASDGGTGILCTAQSTLSKTTLICQHPDRLEPAADARAVLRYAGNGEPAATWLPARGGRGGVFAVGVPFESIPDAEGRARLLRFAGDLIFSRGR